MRSSGMRSMVISKNIQSVIVALLIASIGAFYLGTIRAGHVWGDDFAMYIQEAKDIASGVSYTHSNYIFNPQNTDVGPKTFPPIYPVFLSPVYALFGMNLTAMKVENILFFLGFLLVFFLLVKEELTFPYSVAPVATIGFSPYVWFLKDAVVSEMAFLFFLFLCLFWAVRIFKRRPETTRFQDAALLSLLIYLCYGTRTIGIVLLPALFCYEVAYLRRLPRFSAMVAIFFLVPWFVQSKISSSEGNYLALLRGLGLSFNIFLGNFKGYAQDLSTFWANGYSKFGRLALFSAFSVFSGIGYALRFFKRQASITEFYVPFHLLATVLWPSSAGLRYLIPIVPLYVLYGFLGLSLLGSVGTSKLQSSAFVAFLLCIGLSYVGQYSKADFGPIPEGIGKRETQEFFQYVRTRTEPDAVFIFRKPKALGLFGERRSSVYPATGTDRGIWAYITNIHASYLVEGPSNLDEPYWHPFLARNQARWVETYSNSDFKVYKITGSP